MSLSWALHVEISFKSVQVANSKHFLGPAICSVHSDMTKKNADLQAHRLWEQVEHMEEKKRNCYFQEKFKNSPVFSLNNNKLCYLHCPFL